MTKERHENKVLGAIKGILKSEKLGLIIALILIIAIFQWLTEGKFFTGKT